MLLMTMWGSILVLLIFLSLNTEFTKRQAAVCELLEISWTDVCCDWSVLDFSSAIKVINKSTPGSLRYSSKESKCIYATYQHFLLYLLLLRYNYWTVNALRDGTNTICFRLQNEKWMNVRVGDIIKLENNQFVAVSVKLFRIYYNQTGQL